MTAAKKKGLFNFDLTAVYTPENSTRERLGRSLVSLETSVAAMLQACKSYFILHSCREIDMARASSFAASAPVLGETARLFVTSPPYNFQRLKRSESSAHYGLSLRETKNTFELILMQLGNFASLFCTAQWFAVWHTLFSGKASTQDDSLPSSSAST